MKTIFKVCAIVTMICMSVVTVAATSSPLLNTTIVRQAIRYMPGWHYDVASKAIAKTFHFSNYYHTIEFVNAVAWIANDNNHHPTLTVTYNTCKVTFTTDDVGGLTRKDITSAREVDALIAHRHGK